VFANSIRSAVVGWRTTPSSNDRAPARLELFARAIDVNPELRVIYMSGYSDAVLADRRQASAHRALLSNPFPPDALLAAVSAVLREQRLA
jgi:DNA-binding NarL/FixJ family response regulator